MRNIFLILFLLIGTLSYGQTTTFTQTFVDRCTGNTQVVVANFVNGSATVAFYNKVRTFTYQEFMAGELQSWLTETYLWWQQLSPCSTSTAETQQAQQTAQNATAAAQTASTAASSATSSVPPPSTNTSTNATSNTNTSNTSSQSTSGTSTSGNESSSTGNSSGGSEGGTTDGSNTSEGSSNEGSQTSESQGEDTSTESKSESDGGGSDENKETESKETESSEENKEESKEEEVKEEESKEESEEDSEESEDEESDEESEENSEDEEEEKKESKMLPIQLRADMMANQALLGNYDIVTSIGATQSSIFGDETYGATAMIWSNLRQFSLNGSYTKVHMEKLNISTLNHGNHTHYSKIKDVTSNDPITPPTPKLKSITSISAGYMNNFGNGATMTNVMKIKPTKYGTFGVGVNLSNMFSENDYQMTTIGYNILYTNQMMLTDRINYAPAFIWTQSPYVGRLEWVQDEWGKNRLQAPNLMRGQRIHGMMILANSFTVQLTRRFSFNVGATFIKSTDPNIPLIKSFMIGAKLPF